METFANYHAGNNSIVSYTFVATVMEKLYSTDSDEKLQKALNELHDKADQWISAQGANLLNLTSAITPYGFENDRIFFKCSVTVVGEISEEVAK